MMLTGAGSYAAINTTKLGQFHLGDNTHSGYTNSLGKLQKWTTGVKTVLWDVTPCSPAKVNLRFVDIYCLSLQGMLASKAKQGILLFTSCWVLLLCEPEERGSMLLRNVEVLPDYTASHT